MHDTSFMFYQGRLPAAAGSADGIPPVCHPSNSLASSRHGGKMIHLLCFIRGRGRHPCPFTVRDMPVMGRNGPSQLLQVTRITIQVAQLDELETRMQLSWLESLQSSSLVPGPFTIEAELA